MPRFLTRNNVLLTAIIIAGGFFRFYRLDTLPPGFEFDVAFKVFDALRLLQGQFAVFFPAYTGREPLFHYLSMPFVALFGPTAIALKLSAAIIGTATIPLVYAFARDFFSPSLAERGGVRVRVSVALLASFFTAISFWHIFFSRVGYRVILLVPLTVLMFWMLWRAMSPSLVGDGGRKGWGWMGVGLFAGLALYTYPAARVFPIALILLTTFVALSDRTNARAYLKGLGRALLVATIVFLPLGIYFAFNPDQFIGHPADVSIFAPRGDQPPDLATALVNNALRLLGMFFVAGDAGALRNLPARPVFDPFTAVLFLIGVIVWAVALFSPRGDALNRRRAMFLLAWLGMALGIALLSNDAPNFSRMLFAVPAIMLLAAWGAAELLQRWRAGAVAVLLVVIVSTTISFRDYFMVWANDPATYYAFDADKVEIADWLNRNAPTHQIFLAPLLQENGTISLLTRLAPVKSFDSRDTIILPSHAAGKDAVFVFPWEQEKRIQTMATRLGALGERQDLQGANDGKLILLYRVPAQNLPDAKNPLPTLARAGDFARPQKIERAAWNDSFELLGYTIDAADAAKRNLEVTLFFHALAPTPDDYTFSVKVRDGRERVWGQEDKWTGNNSYATTQWSPGDVIIEKFYPGLNACAPAGEYRITVEAYNPKASTVLGEPVSLGAWRVDVSPSNRLEDLEPAQTLDQSISSQLRLLGYTLSSGVLKAGEHFSLALFWRGVGKGSAEKINVRLQNTPLTETIVQIPVEGRGLCSFFDFVTPATLPAGNIPIWVNASKLTEVSISK